MTQKKYYDISRLLASNIAVWPGDTKYKLQEVMRQSEGDSVNVSTLTMSAHTGTHIDAPFHYDSQGLRVNNLEPDIYWGTAQVVSIEKSDGPIFPEDLVEYDLGMAKRLLLHSNASEGDPSIFPEKIIYSSSELAEFMGEKGIVLFGTDAPSVDDINDPKLPGHHALNKNGISILEGLDLSMVPDGVYELSALPLNIMGGDGSPVRAVLREMG